MNDDEYRNIVTNHNEYCHKFPNLREPDFVLDMVQEREDQMRKLRNDVLQQIQQTKLLPRKDIHAFKIQKIEVKDLTDQFVVYDDLLKKILKRRDELEKLIDEHGRPHEVNANGLSMLERLPDLAFENLVRQLAPSSLSAFRQTSSTMLQRVQRTRKLENAPRDLNFTLFNGMLQLADYITLHYDYVMNDGTYTKEIPAVIFVDQSEIRRRRVNLTLNFFVEETDEFMDAVVERMKTCWIMQLTLDGTKLTDKIMKLVERLKVQHLVIRGDTNMKCKFKYPHLKSLVQDGDPLVICPLANLKFIKYNRNLETLRVSIYAGAIERLNKALRHWFAGKREIKQWTIFVTGLPQSFVKYEVRELDKKCMRICHFPDLGKMIYTVFDSIEEAQITL